MCVGGVGLYHVPLPPPFRHPIPPPRLPPPPHFLPPPPPPPLAWLSPWLSLLLSFSLFFSFFLSLHSRRRLEESSLDSSPP